MFKNVNYFIIFFQIPINSYNLHISRR